MATSKYMFGCFFFQKNICLLSQWKPMDRRRYLPMPFHLQRCPSFSMLGHPSNTFFSILCPTRKRTCEREAQSLVCSLHMGYISGTLNTKPILKKKWTTRNYTCDLGRTKSMLLYFFSYEISSYKNRSFVD